MNLKSQDRNKKRALPCRGCVAQLGTGSENRKPLDLQSPKEESFENISGSIPLLVDATRGGREQFNSSASFCFPPPSHHNADRQALITRYYSFILLESKVI